MSTTGDRTDWQVDVWGMVNEAPPEAVDFFGGLLESVRTMPAFQDARRWLFERLRVPAGGAVLEAGCGVGVALPDLLDAFGKDTRITGIDPTTAFIATARERAAQLDAPQTRYEIGDIRALPFTDGEFDVAFCDKILVHVRPVQRAVDEMARVVRPGGHVGAVEWYAHLAISTSRPELAEAYNSGLVPLNHMVIANLGHHFRAAGLQEVAVQPFVAYTQGLDAHPGWRALTVDLLPLFAQGGQIAEADARAIIDDLEDLDAQGGFSACFLVYAAVGTKPN